MHSLHRFRLAAVFSAAALTFALATTTNAQAVPDSAPSLVLTATLPIPLPDKTERPLPPDRLRAESPWTLSLAGDWRFRLTHGEIKDGHFALSAAETTGLRVSSAEGGHDAADAFDGNSDTRWCANGDAFPQWLQAKLPGAYPVTGMDIAWEESKERYTCRVEAGEDGIHWQTLLDRSAAPGVGDGPLPLPESGTRFRYVRLVILGGPAGRWASVRELKFHYRDGLQDVVWHPAPPSDAAPAHADDFVSTNFQDNDWDHLAVPSNWEMPGYSIPTYNAVDDTVGLYRRWVEVPPSWAGRDIFWHFDGALDGAEIYVNGRRAGYHESGYTAFDVDLTGLLIPGRRNLLAVRVCKTTPSVDCETGDYQCMGGIYRDTRLIAVPPTHVSDLTVQTPLSADYHDATLQVSAQIKGKPGEAVSVNGYVTEAASPQNRLPGALAGNGTIGPDGSVILALSTPVVGPRLWSAEKPALYYVTLALQVGADPVETVEQRFGFRQVEIKNDIVLWNGQPIKCTGVCRHDFWADKGFALTDAEWTKDLTLMKWTNVNAIRTSHYNHAARFLELCEERGFYILDEVPFCWISDKVKDPAFAPPLLQRAAETVARDKNRPCVLAWSLGNENPEGENNQRVHDLVTRLDPTRPSFASEKSPRQVKGQQFFDSHYPSPESIKNYVNKDSNVAPEVITEHPHTFYSLEAQTYDPGASDAWSEGLIATWDLLWRSPTVLGSFIWEWQNQGVADKFPDHITDFYYGLDHMRQENNKGIMDAYRHPKAEQWIVKMVYSPVQFASRNVRSDGGDCTVGVTNRYAFTDLNELTFHWTALQGNVALAHGEAHVACPPGQTADAKFPAPAGLTALQLEVDRADGTNVTVARLEAPGAKPLAAPPALADHSPLFVHDGEKALEVSNGRQQVTFDKHSGAIESWKVGGRDRLGKGESHLNLGEAKTARGEHYYRAKQPPVTDNATVSAQTNQDGSVHVTSRSQVHPAAGSAETLGTLTADYTVQPDAEITVQYKLDWTADDRNLWEFALCLPVPSSSDRQSWSRDSYFTAYPEGHLGAPTGTCGPKDVVFRASKRSLHFLTLTDNAGTGVALIAKDEPLIGRAISDASGITLVASREIAAAGPDDLSLSWFRAHDIHANKSKPLSGEFVLRAIGTP